MKRTLIVCSHNRPIQAGTQAILAAMNAAGAGYISQEGVADVSLARNIGLTGAAVGARQLNKSIAEQHARGVPNLREPFDTVLMVDDDMLFTIEQAQALIDHSRETAIPASAMYATLNSHLAGCQCVTPEGERQRWWTGLGLLAIPLTRLHELEADSEQFEMPTGFQRAFTSSGVLEGRWMSEDYMLCKRLGGVHLLPIAVGHLKTVPIYPDQSTIDRIANGLPLPSGDTEPRAPIQVNATAAGVK